MALRAASFAEVSVKTTITPPAEEEGVPPLDWSQVPEFVETANDKRVPLFLPVVPPETTGTVNITIQSNSELSFQLQTWVNPPMVKSLVQDSLAVTECGLAVTNEILNIAGLIPGVSCLEATREFVLHQYLGAVQDAVHDRRVGQSGNPVMSLTELSVDFAYFAGRCLGGELPGSTIWELGQIVIGGMDVFAACQEPFRRLTESGLPVTSVFSRDPNDKVGSLGAGSQRYVSGGEPLRYVIYFENVPTATAPAQDVGVIDQLDLSNLQRSTFSFGTIGFGNKQVTPPPGVTNFATDIDLRPGRNLIVKIDAHLDTNTGLLSWRFISIDPDTGLPPEDPLAGFLHPGEEGNVVFTISPTSDLPTGTVISNGASIVFDTNQAIQTPTWFNALDNSKPASHVLPLPATQNSASFNVQWSGTDSGSGIKDYSVFVSQDGRPYAAWLSNVTVTQGTFNGEIGSSYSFYAIARDLTGNLENTKTVAEATTTVSDTEAPRITACAPNKTLSANGSNQIPLPNLIGEVAATDNFTPTSALTISQSPAAGTMIGLGTTPVTITVRDAANNAATCIALVSVSGFSLRDFVVFSWEFTRLLANAKIITGSIGANTSLPDPNGPPDDKEEVEIGEHVLMVQAGSSVVGDTLRLRANAQVKNAFFNELLNTRADILGSRFTPLALPLLTFPVLPPIAAGTQDIEVLTNQAKTLAPGRYRKITVKTRGTLILTGGIYEVSSLDIRQDTNILFKGPAEVRVKNEFDTDAKTYIGPDASASNLSASQIVFYAEGRDDRGRHHDEDGDLTPTVVQIGQRNMVVANIYAPNGTVWLKSNTKATGAYIGKRARIGNGVELKLASAF